MKKYYVYILRCKGNNLYIGFTSNLKRRLSDHKSGNGCLFTKNKLPVKLVYYEKFNDFMRAKNRENQIKGWNRKKKENLIKYNHPAGIV
jgi:putative endonuclease